MFHELIAATIYETLSFLVKNPRSLGKDGGKEAEALPTPIKNYLATTTEADFLHDLKGACAYLKKGKVKNAKNGLLLAVLEILTRGLAVRMDLLAEADSASLQSDAQKTTLITKMIKSPTLDSHALRKLLLRRSYQELNNAIANLARALTDRPLLVVQSPRPIAVELKKTIRDHFEQEHHLSFPIFQVNKQLIGGLRVFNGGRVRDHSWFARVIQLTSLTH